MENQKKENHISVLVIGRSGAGKSEFIMSLIDEKQRKLFPASGKSQTTRSTAKYVIDYTNSEEPKEPTFEVTLKSEKDFVDERMESFDSYFEDDENNLSDFVDIDEYSFNLLIDEFKISLIYSNAFFNCNEFDCGEDVVKMFNDKFSQKFWNEQSDLNIKEKSDDYEKFARHFKEFFGEVYEKCRACIPQENETFSVKPDDSNIGEIEKYLKINEENKSYSALVKSIEVNVSGSEVYKNMFQENKIDSITLIDTCGLDHDDSGLGNKLLQRRYTALLRNEFPDIKAVLYLRNISGTDSPVDLRTGIVNLFKVEPSVVPYVIFTKIDLISEIYKESKAYGELTTNAIKNIKVELFKNKVSKVILERRADEILKTIIGYASKYDKKTPEEIKSLQAQNIDGLKKIFSSIRFEKYLGGAFIPIQQMKLEKMQSVLSVEGLFKNRNLEKYPAATKGAIRRRIKQPEEERILGFYSSTRDSTRWSDIISDDLNSRFKSFDVTEYLENVPETIGVIAELFLQFSKNLYRGSRDYNYVSNLYNNKSKGFPEDSIKQLIMYLYEDRKRFIYAGYNTVGEYLTKIYEFETISDETKEKLQTVINDCYNTWFINKCREHNAKKLAENIIGNLTYEEREERLKNYYQTFDSEISEDEKLTFEMYVNKYEKSNP